MMKAAVGSKFRVIGSSSAIVTAGPMPGSTPTSVPRVTPSAAKSRYSGRSAVPKPPSRLPRTSIGYRTGARMPWGSRIPRNAVKPK